MLLDKIEEMLKYNFSSYVLFDFNESLIIYHNTHLCNKLDNEGVFHEYNTRARVVRGVIYCSSYNDIAYIQIFI